jgi:hypothetical protein
MGKRTSLKPNEPRYIKIGSRCYHPDSRQKEVTVDSANMSSENWFYGEVMEIPTGSKGMAS